MKQLFSIFVLLSFFLVPYAFAEDKNNVQSEKMATVAAADDEDVFTLASMTCADIFDLFEDADPSIKENMDSEAVMDAQDDVLDLLTWVHGYVNGRDGIGSSRFKLNKSGIEKLLASIVLVCKPNEEKLFLDVVSKIK